MSNQQSYVMYLSFPVNIYFMFYLSSLEDKL
jgi:hypothetical protein